MTVFNDAFYNQFNEYDDNGNIITDDSEIIEPGIPAHIRDSIECAEYDDDGNLIMDEYDDDGNLIG